MVLLVAANVYFLWMFLAVAPIEHIADSGGFTGVSRDVAYRFAADWRHGMAGNSWLYMPGFFAVAIAAWLQAATASLRRFARDQAVALAIAAPAAIVAASIAAPAVLAGFLDSVHGSSALTAPAVSPRALRDGIYTAFVWAIFVAGTRHAFAGRSLWPLAPAALLTIGLALMRPWTVGDFTTLWADRLRQGDVVAWISVLAIPGVGTAFVWIARRSSARPEPAQHPAARH